MKSLFASALVILAAVIANPSHADLWPRAQQETKEVTLSINDAYVPSGLKSTDDAYVVVNGLFPNGCYRWNRAEQTRGQDNPQLILIRSIATVSQGMCIMVLVPFSQEVKLGGLQSGQYTLRFVNGDGTYMEKGLSIN